MQHTQKEAAWHNTCNQTHNDKKGRQRHRATKTPKRETYPLNGRPDTGMGDKTPEQETRHPTRRHNKLGEAPAPGPQRAAKMETPRQQQRVQPKDTQLRQTSDTERATRSRTGDQSPGRVTRPQSRRHNRQGKATNTWSPYSGEQEAPTRQIPKKRPSHTNIRQWQRATGDQSHTRGSSQPHSRPVVQMGEPTGQGRPQPPSTRMAMENRLSRTRKGEATADVSQQAT